ncbi:MAG: CBS domain-containing protein [Sulfuricella sp.]|nr:CBS domain-containing protein [Sulfuricella sp.]
MSIAHIPCRPQTLCLKPDATLMEALRLMLDEKINHVPLCDGDGRYCGVISTAAILQELIPAGARGEHGLSDLTFAGDATRLLTAHLHDLEARTVGEIAKTATPVLEENCPTLEAALLLSQNHAPLPVVSADGILRGMLSLRAFLDYLLRYAEAEHAR